MRFTLCSIALAIVSCLVATAAEAPTVESPQEQLRYVDLPTHNLVFFRDGDQVYQVERKGSGFLVTYPYQKTPDSKVLRLTAAAFRDQLVLDLAERGRLPAVDRGPYSTGITPWLQQPGNVGRFLVLADLSRPGEVTVLDHPAADRARLIEAGPEHLAISRAYQGKNLLPQVMQGEGKFMLAGCEKNLKNLSTALRVYAMDHDGRFPASLEAVKGPSFMRICPAAQKSTYELNTSKDGKAFSLRCRGRHHAPLGQDFPRSSSQGGVVEK